MGGKITENIRKLWNIGEEGHGEIPYGNFSGKISGEKKSLNETSQTKPKAVLIRLYFLKFAIMSSKEKENRYREAVRYIENAADILRTKANKNGKYYEDGRYVRMACGTAYNGVLLAIETYLEAKGKSPETKKGSRISVNHYRKRLGT